MAGLDTLLQRIARSLEEAGAQQPGDDLRARLGYGTGDDDEDEPAPDAAWEEERERRSAGAPATTRTPVTARDPETAWKPGASRAPARPSARTGASETHRASLSGSAFRSSLSAPAAPRHSHASPASALPLRIRTRLGTPDALREAFVVKEILDRPLARRPRK